MPEAIRLGTVYYVDYTTSHPISGARDADVTPRFWVFKNNDTTGLNVNLSAALFTIRGNFPGNYYASFEVSTGVGFNTGVYYNLVASGSMAGVTRYDAIRTFYAQAYTADDIVPSLSDVYFADIEYNLDDGNMKDEINVSWYKNSMPISGFTSPKITIFNRSDGSLFLPETDMSGVGSTNIGARYDTIGSSNRLLEGQGYLIKTSAIIDSGTRLWYRWVSRDLRVN